MKKPAKITRTARCLSTNLDWQEEWIVCHFCGYNEPLRDFTENHQSH